METERVTMSDGSRGGRLDVLAEFRGGLVAIELDARSPRRKSLEKLRQFTAFRVIGLRGVSMRPPAGIDAVVMLDIGPDPSPDFEKLVKAYPGRVDNRARKAAFSQFIARLRQGFPAAQLLDGMKCYAAWCAAKMSPDEEPLALAAWLSRAMWEHPWE